MKLRDIKATVEQYENNVKTLQSLPETPVIQDAVKKQIIKVWGAEGEVIPSGVKLVTSETISSDFSNKECLIAALASELVVVLKEYQKSAEIFYLKLNHKGVNFRSDFKETKNDTSLQPSFWGEYKSLINESTLDDNEKENLIGFVVDSREFGGCKGIGRDDFYTPAVCRRSISLSVTHHSRIARLADKLSENKELAALLVNLALQGETEKSTKGKLNLLNAFKLHLQESGVIFPEILPVSLCSALHAKAFVILTGLSGSGKTQLAQAFSKWICESDKQIEMIAVGADWTSNENLLGYPDALNAGHYRKPDNGALDLILRAKDDETNPYFLILDEMNLSHVERYFADFLSAMESGEAINLHDGGEDELWDGVPGKLKIRRTYL